MDLEKLIEPVHPSGLCAICDNAVEEGEPAKIVTVHGNQYLVHAFCLESD